MSLGLAEGCVPGGAGFLGSVVANRLAKHGAGEIIVPRGSDYDLVKGEDVRRLLNDTRPDVILQLAANVGGIGANRAHPAEFFSIASNPGRLGRIRLLSGRRSTGSGGHHPPKGNHARRRHPQWDTQDTR